MTITNSVSPLPLHTGLATAQPAASTHAAPSAAAALPQAPEGLGGRKAGPKPADSGHRQLRAQLPPPMHSLSEAMLRPYTFEHPVAGNSKTLLAIDAPLWKGSDAQLAAHRIVLDAVQSHLKNQLTKPGDVAAPGSALEKFASGKLDHVYVDTKNFKELAAAAGPVDGQPGKFPVYVDTQRNQLVVNIDHAFTASDELSPVAEHGLSAALGLGKKGLDFLPSYRAIKATPSIRRRRGRTSSSPTPTHNSRVNSRT